MSVMIEEFTSYQGPGSQPPPDQATEKHKIRYEGKGGENVELCH